MRHPHVTKLIVTIGDRRVGMLARGDDGQIWFEYDSRWIATGYSLAPRTMEFDVQPRLAKSDVFGGLHGAFADSLPDGWGLLLMDREFKRLFDWDPHEITPMDRLAYLGSRAMGALEYSPVYEQEPAPDEVDVGALAKSASAFLRGSESEVLTQLRIQGGSPGGARPKVTIARSADSLTCLSGFNPLPDGYSHWIVKFRSQDDPRDMGRIERAYAEMAAIAGVGMPRTDIVTVNGDKQSDDYFGVERFDRYAKNGKRHIISLAGLVYANYRLPCMDYDTILSIVGAVTQDRAQVERAFRLMVFNVLTHNKDDHVKNFAFVHDEAHGWRLSPAFDLTHSAGMGGEHMTAINGHGNPSLAHVLAIGKKHQIASASQIVGEVLHAVAQWTSLAHKWHVTSASAALIKKSITQIAKRFDAIPLQQYGANSEAVRDEISPDTSPTETRDDAPAP